MILVHWQLDDFEKNHLQFRIMEKYPCPLILKEQWNNVKTSLTLSVNITAKFHFLNIKTEKFCRRQEITFARFSKRNNTKTKYP